MAPRSKDERVPRWSRYSWSDDVSRTLDARANIAFRCVRGIEHHAHTRRAVIGCALNDALDARQCLLDALFACGASHSRHSNLQLFHESSSDSQLASRLPVRRLRPRPAGVSIWGQTVPPLGGWRFHARKL